MLIFCALKTMVGINRKKVKCASFKKRLAIEPKKCYFFIILDRDNKDKCHDIILILNIVIYNGECAYSRGGKGKTSWNRHLLNKY